MNAFSFPWLHAAIGLPLVAAFIVHWMRDSARARLTSLFVSGLAFVCTVGGWVHLAYMHHSSPNSDSHSLWDGTLIGVDDLNAPLLPLVALLFFLTVLATIGVKVQRVSFTSMLFSEALVLATLACRQPWALIAMLFAGAIPPMVELNHNARSVRVFVIYMSLFTVLLVVGQGLIDSQPAGGAAVTVGTVLLMAAALLRSGILPVHSWMPDLFQRASFGTALLYVAPMVGPYVAMRLVFPIAPSWLLNLTAWLAIATSLYAAGMALVQKNARQLFCYLFLSNSSLVLVGVATATPMAVTAALCMWISVALAMTGFGLALRAIESRTGSLTLTRFHGLIAHTPRLAALFLISGLAAVGFPGTIGFVSAELLVSGIVSIKPFIGGSIVVVAALNGLAVLQVYFRVFAGSPHISSIEMQSRRPEWSAVLIICGLILAGGIYPQLGVASRYLAARKLVDRRLEAQESKIVEHLANHKSQNSRLISDKSHDNNP